LTAGYAICKLEWLQMASVGRHGRPKPGIDPKSAVTATVQGRLAETKRRQQLPFLAVSALFVLFLSSGNGVAFSVVSVVFGLRIEGDVPSRVLVFLASVLSLTYIVIHICGSRTYYTVTQHGPPWIYGNYLHGSALLLTRIGFGLWIAAIVATCILVSDIGITSTATTSQLSIYINLVICVIAL
jgi:hypothetical protein